MINNNFGNNEIIHVVESVSKEKGLAKEEIFKIIEDALSTIAKTKYGNDISIQSKIHRVSGQISFFRKFLVTDNESTHETQGLEKLSVLEAQSKSPSLKEGDFYKEFLPPLERERHIATKTRQIITTKILDLVREKLYEEYKDRVGDIISGIVEKINQTSFIIKIFNNTEAILKKDQSLNTDFLHLGDRVKAYLVKLNQEPYGPMLVLSRTHKEFVKKLFIQEVPEIYEKTILIKDIARDSGSRTKISVYSTDPSIDPVGACVGMRGIRVQQVIQELRGEKIDIIKWSADPGTYIVNALDSLEVIKVIIDELQHKIEVIVKDIDLSQAIGRKGQNVRLISELIGWKIDIFAESSENDKRKKEFIQTSQKFQEALNLEKTLAELLISEGYNSITALANTQAIIISKIEGINEEVGQAIINRAKTALSKR